MGINSVANVVITSNSRGITVKGFGTPLVIGKHSKWPERIKSYDGASVLDDLVTDGFSTYDPIYRTVAGIVSSQNRVRTVKVGRLLDSFDQIIKLSVKSAAPVEGDVYAFELLEPGGTSHAISHTVGAAESQSACATAIAALINAVTGVTAAAVGADITVEADASDVVWIFKNYRVDQFEFIDNTADETNLVSELTAIRNIDADWYGFVLADCPSKARLLALSAYAETIDVLFLATTFDTDHLTTGSTTNFMYTANAADYFRTIPIFSAYNLRMRAATWMGVMFPYTPGNATWAFKALSGEVVDTLEQSQMDAIEGYGGNFYVLLKGSPVTYPGKVASGEWIDTVRFRDWVVARIEEAKVSLLINTPKIPYTNPGADMITKEVRAVLEQGVTNGGIDGEQPITVTHPDVREVPTANKIARLLPDVRFECTLAGAIHATNFTGVLKV